MHGAIAGRCCRGPAQSNIAISPEGAAVNTEPSDGFTFARAPAATDSMPLRCRTLWLSIRLQDCSRCPSRSRVRSRRRRHRT